LDELCVNVEQIYAIFWLSCDFIIFYDDMNLLCQLMTIVLSQMLCHVSCRLYKTYDESFCYKIFATSFAMWLATSSYDEHFCHKDFVMSAAMSHVISHVERHNCMNCDVFRHTYDELECHRFSDNCGVS
jgi:hypothetical protein